MLAWLVRRHIRRLSVEISQEYLRERVTYDPLTGLFAYNERPQSHFRSSRACNAWNARFAGALTGTKDSRGHIQIKLDGKRYLAHRMAFLYMSGAIPEEVDHIDRNKTNNAWANLRSADRSQNAANREARGAYLTSSGRFRAQICVNYKIVHLGTFDTESEAISAYQNASNRAFGQFSPYLHVAGREQKAELA